MSVFAAGNKLPSVESVAWKLDSFPFRFTPRGGVEKLERRETEPAMEGMVLALHADHFESYGCLTSLATGIVPGRHYQFSVWRRTEGVDFPALRVPVILSWLGGSKGENLLQRDYVDQSSDASEGPARLSRTLQAPAEASCVRVELVLRWAAASSVWWGTPCLREVAPPSSRKVRIVTTRIQPPNPSSVEANTQLMAEMFDRVTELRPDVLLFSENLVDRSVRLPLQEVAQSIPGPLTEMLSKKARRLGAWVVTTLHEVDHEGRYYNTAVLIDREGSIAGCYRKIHLTMEEAEEGMLPGSDYFVFDTDFGRIGIMTCWDNWFPEAARILRLLGAEIVLLPIAGDGVPGHWEAVSRTRAIDNGIYLVSSSTVTEIPSQIINPAGEILAEANGGFGHAVHEIDLNQQWRVRYLSVGSCMGEAHSLYMEERRPDTYHPLCVRKA